MRGHLRDVPNQADSSHVQTIARGEPAKVSGQEERRESEVMEIESPPGCCPVGMALQGLMETKGQGPCIEVSASRMALQEE